LIDTPLTDVTPQEKASISELSLLLMSSVLRSCPYINEDEKSGTVIQNVIPIPGKEHERSGSGSLLQFNWHTENVHEEHPAEFLMLLCLRGDKNAFTSFMLIEDILSGLDEQFLHLLLTTKFLMKTGPSYHKVKVCLRSILTLEEDGGYTIVYNSDIARCCPQDEIGKKVYIDFQNYIEKSVPTYAISLEPGECVIIKNREALHKRDGFVVSTTVEERRWLQRVYLKSPQYLHNNGRPSK
jgi:L-asparagine oxygenase